MRIQHNIPSMNAYRNFTSNSKAINKNLEKLSSGYKINRAGDDAAGLAISEKMRAQITGLEVAQKNAKDGISLIQTAEGALTEVHDMLNRMVTLAEQSANGTYDASVDRQQLQKEVESLRTEIDRIAQSANFNGINLLDGSLSGDVTKDAAVAVPTVTASAQFEGRPEITWADDVDEATMNALNEAVDGQTLTFTADADAGTITALDTTSLDLGDFTAVADFGTGLAAGADGSVTFQDKDGKTVATLNFKTAAAIDANGTMLLRSGNNVNESSDIVGNVDTDGNVIAEDGVKFTWADGVTKDDKKALNAVIEDASLTATYDDTNAEYNVTISGLDAAYTFEFNDGNALSDANATGTGVIKKGNTEIAKVTLTFTQDSGGSADTVSLQKAKLEAGIENGKGSPLKLQIGDTSDEFNQLKVSVDSVATWQLGKFSYDATTGFKTFVGNLDSSHDDYDATAKSVADIDISTQDGAKEAMDVIKAAINYVSDTRGGLGAMQNRLEHTINNLSVMQENMQDAESTIRDTDVAEEMMKYTKNNILVQSAQAMLAQANQLPQGVLQLLQ